MLLIIFYCLEALPFIVSVFYWKKIRNTHYKWFSLYLLYIIATDVFGKYLISHNIPNQHFYDYFVIPVEFLFFYWLLYRALKSGSSKRLPAIATGLYLLSFLVDVFYFAKHVYPFYSFSYSVGNLLLLVLILSFFIQMINSDAVLTYRSNMMFWISTGLLIFYLGSCPYYGLRNTFVEQYHRINIVYNNIVLLLDCIMYLMFTFSFVWGKPNLRSSRY